MHRSGEFSEAASVDFDFHLFIVGLAWRRAAVRRAPKDRIADCAGFAGLMLGSGTIRIQRERYRKTRTHRTLLKLVWPRCLLGCGLSLKSLGTESTQRQTCQG